MDTIPDAVHQGRRSTKRLSTLGLRLDIEETHHSRDPAVAHRQKQAGSTVRHSPGKRASENSGSRLTERALNLGGSDDSRVLHTAEWLHDLRLHYGRPSNGAEPENQPPRATPPGAAANGLPAERRPSDAAVLAAALAARLQPSPLEQQLPSSNQRSSRSSAAAGVPGSSAFERSPQRRYSSPAIASPSHHRTTPAALSEVPLTPPRPSGSKADRLSRRHTASTVTPAVNSQRCTSNSRSSMSDLSLVEKAVVVGVGTLLYPFVRTPPSGGSSAAAAQPASIKQDAQAEQPPAAARQSTPAPVSNLDARLTDAGASPSKAADVFAATATFTPPQSPSRQPPDSGAGSGAASAAPAVGQLDGEATPYAQSPLRMPPPLQQAAPSPISLLGGYDQQELMTISPSGDLAEATVLTPPSASIGTAGGLLITPRSAGEDNTPYRTLRETYGSIPAASSADRRAFDASIASAVAQLAEADAALAGVPVATAVGDNAAGADSVHVTAEHGGAKMTSNPLFSAQGSPGGAVAVLPQAAADSPSAAQHNGEPTASSAPPAVAAPAASSPCKPSTTALPATAANLPQPAAKRQWHWLSVRLLVTLLCILGVGLLAAYDPVHGRISADMVARRAHYLVVASTAATHRAHADALHAARHGPAYAQQVAVEGWHGIKAAAAAARQAVVSAPAAAQHLWRHSTAVLAADTQAVLASAQRLAVSVAASEGHAAAASVRAARQAATWPAACLKQPSRGCWMSMLTAMHAAHAGMVDSVQGAASAASEMLRQDWRRVSAAALRITRHIPRSPAELAAIAAAAGSAMRHAGVASSEAAQRQLQAAGARLARPLLAAAPASPPPKAANSRVWDRITHRSPRDAAGHAESSGAANKQAAPHTRTAMPAQVQRPAAAKRDRPPSAKAAVKPQRSPNAAGVSQAAAVAANSVDKPKLEALTPATAKAVAAAPSRVQPRVAPHTAKAAGSSEGAAAQRNTSSSAGAAAAGAAAMRAAVSTPAVRSPSAQGLPAAAGTARLLPGQAALPAFGASAAAAGCLAALAVCVLLAVAYWLRLLPGARALQQEHLDSTGDEDVYGGPDAIEPDGLDELFDGHDFYAAPALAVNPRRHTIATTRPQGREFAWLRPNEVVTRPTSASGGRGLDYLWLRSRVVVKLSPEIRNRVARSSTMKRLSQDTSCRSPMGALRDIDFACRGGAAAELKDAPATPMSAGAAAARRASRRLTLG